MGGAGEEEVSALSVSRVLTVGIGEYSKEQKMSGKHINERDKKMKRWFMKEQKPLISLFSYSSPLLRAFFFNT